MSAVLNIWGLPGGGSIHSNLFSYGWDVSDSPFGRYSPHVSPNHFAVTRKPDKYSTELFLLCQAGDSIDLIKVTLTYTDEDGYPAKGSLLFSDTAISSINMSGKGSPVEQISFHYGSFTQEW
jgi:type VI protein secretion system component Hcp